MHKRVDENGLMHVGALILFLVVCVCVFFGYQRIVGGTVEPSGPGCQVTEGVEVCVSTSSTDIAHHDKIEVTTTVKNVSRKPVAYSSVRIRHCGGPNVVLNNKKLEIVASCPTVEPSESKLAPGARLRFTDVFYGDEFNPGANVLKAKWQGKYSADLTVIAKDQTAEEKRQAENCLKGQAESYCVLLPVSLQDDHNRDDASCDELHAPIATLGIAPYECRSNIVEDITYAVPAADADDWEARLLTIKQVSYVYGPYRNDGSWRSFEDDK